MGMKRHIELLAPAGSFEAMKAAYTAGADAVYIGGGMFGARAYADNPDEDRLLSAIDYAHIRDRKLYLTVNTLLKDQELEGQLYDYLKPLYEQGLDAVIVQDLGVLRFVKTYFPDMHIHASTQMTITGANSAAMLQELGVTRVVTARELSLSEIAQIRKNTTLEIESFVHGAICYSYSGQCLFSSLAGGRSGNRGRCAQPCRKPYQVYDENGGILNPEKDRQYVLSLKDMNTLHLLPQIIEAGVDSLKIEGRMKKPEYTAGVVSIYRKYLDRYLAGEDCTVSEEDEEHLFDLFNRNGFSEGYYKQKNGENMLTMKEPQFRSRDDAWKEQIRENYIDRETKRKIKGSAIVYQHLPVTMTLTVGDTAYCLTAEEPLEARNRPLDEEQLKKQMEKLGGTDFEYEELELDLGENCFLTVGQMNALRRSALEGLRNALLQPFLRTAKPYEATANVQEHHASGPMKFTAQVHTPEQLEEVLKEEKIETVYVDHTVSSPEQWKKTVQSVHDAGKHCFYHTPQIFRKAQEEYYEKHLAELTDAGFDGFLLGSLEAVAYLKNKGIPGMLMADHGLYSLNARAKEQLLQMGVSMTTASVELNEAELLNSNMEHCELIGYGYLPMMVTANCLCRTLVGCQKGKGALERQLQLADDQHRRFPVMVDCANCMNTILNCAPLYLLDYTKKLEALAPESIRLIFTVENRKQVQNILSSCRGVHQVPDGITRGHLKRGVE
jgi:putative protease